MVSQSVLNALLFFVEYLSVSDVLNYVCVTASSVSEVAHWHSSITDESYWSMKYTSTWISMLKDSHEKYCCLTSKDYWT